MTWESVADRIAMTAIGLVLLTSFVLWILKMVRIDVRPTPSFDRMRGFVLAAGGLVTVGIHMHLEVAWHRYALIAYAVILLIMVLVSLFQKSNEATTDGDYTPDTLVDRVAWGPFKGWVTESAYRALLEYVIFFVSVALCIEGMLSGQWPLAGVAAAVAIFYLYAVYMSTVVILMPGWTMEKPLEFEEEAD